MTTTDTSSSTLNPSTSPVERRRCNGAAKKYILESSTEEFVDDPDDETFHVSPVKRKESLAKSRRTSKVKTIRQSAIRSNLKKKEDKSTEKSNPSSKVENPRISSVSDDSPCIGESRVKKRAYILDETSDSIDDNSPNKKSKGKLNNSEGEEATTDTTNHTQEIKEEIEKIYEKPKKQTSKRSKVTESQKKRTKTKDKNKSPRKEKTGISSRKTSRKSAAPKKTFVVEDSLVEDIVEEDENQELSEKTNRKRSSVRSKLKNEPLTEIPIENKTTRKVRNSSISRCSVSTISEEGEEKRSRRTKQISYKEPSLNS